ALSSASIASSSTAGNLLTKMACGLGCALPHLPASEGGHKTVSKPSPTKKEKPGDEEHGYLGFPIPRPVDLDGGCHQLAGSGSLPACGRAFLRSCGGDDLDQPHALQRHARGPQLPHRQQLPRGSQALRPALSPSSAPF